MTLGQILAEAKGRVAALRALENGRIEVTLQGTGRVLGIDIGDVTTFWSERRPNGTVYGEGYSIQMGADGGAAEWKGSGIGRSTGNGAWRYAYGGAYKNATSPKWTQLLAVFTVGEYESDENGNYQWKIWEWKY